MAKGEKGSRVKLRTYFLANIGKVMNSDELREVAGTSEWARRVRELRDEEGYQILTHHDRSNLKIGEYLLETDIPQQKPACILAILSIKAWVELMTRQIYGQYVLYVMREPQI